MKNGTYAFGGSYRIPPAFTWAGGSGNFTDTHLLAPSAVGLEKQFYSTNVFIGYKVLSFSYWVERGHVFTKQTCHLVFLCHTDFVAPPSSHASIAITQLDAFNPEDLLNNNTTMTEDNKCEDGELRAISPPTHFATAWIYRVHLQAKVEVTSYPSMVAVVKEIKLLNMPIRLEDGRCDSFFGVSFD
ncbi:hypothetical protein DSO57_1027890 [Entomophthora muscae]|uniref:Uncharacterized protein n=1 Tax=Entomophthora muscae TaxID=34485 RepID=A0ACC2TCU3_9FUNG|nr:hypothetical protein DSO57_1027890 [Entomophthora muscae]